MNLDAAINAARAESLERTLHHQATRERVLESFRHTPSRRLHAVVAAMIASMFGASAFAWHARASQPPAPRAPVIAAVEAMTASEPVTPRLRTTARVESVTIERDTNEPVRIARDAIARGPVQPATVEPATVGPATVEPATVEPATVETTPPAPAAVPHATAPAPDAELALYSTAHALHFQRRDLAAAVAAWDRYLAAAPNGRLVPEARFNRVVALVRLERWTDAATALETLDTSFRPRDIARLRALITAHAK